MKPIQERKGMCNGYMLGSS